MDQEKRRSGRSVRKINDNDRSESNSPSLMDYDEEEEDLGPRRGSRMKSTSAALSKLQVKEDANSLFMSNFDPSVSRKAKLKDKIYKDSTNTAGNISGNTKTTKNTKKELYDSKGLLLLNGLDVCDCLTEECPGCHLPCPKCQSSKCGSDCRNNRKWVYDSIELDGVAESVRLNPYHKVRT